MLPLNLLSLSISENRFQRLPQNLPEYLESLQCAHNKLVSLPEIIPSSLEYLDCAHNQLHTLPETLPNNVWSLDCDGNPHLPKRNYKQSAAEYMERVKFVEQCQSKARIRMRCRAIREELMMVVWHPKRVERLMLDGVDMEDM
jgi:Leucine-rich repeat (LRR) protein